MDFKDYFNKKLKIELAKKLKLKNLMAVPKVIKVVINVGAGEAVKNKKVLEQIQKEISLISGQKAVLTHARKSVSAFKVREGMPIGVKVTLRGQRMYHFLEKLVKIIIPRIKDFRGVSKKSIDGNGNLSIGFSEQTIFPEIDYDIATKPRGLEVTIVTTAKSKDEGRVFFETLGIPFRK